MVKYCIFRMVAVHFFNALKVLAYLLLYKQK